MITQPSKTLFGFLALSLALTLLALFLGQVTAEPASPAADPGHAPDWASPELISTGVGFANKPQIAVSPTGSKILVSFENRFSNFNEPQDNDAYYTSWSNASPTWSAPAPIHISPGEADDSVSPRLAYTANGVAHAVWIEGASGEKLVHAAEWKWPTNNTSNLPDVISAPLLPPGAADPRLIATGNILDVIWSEGAADNPNIYHARSTDGGATWPNFSRMADTITESRAPAIASDPNNPNRLYAVWEEQAQGTISVTTKIVFSQGTYNVTTNRFNWTPPLQISADNPDDAFSDQPTIYVTNRGLHVTYSYRDQSNEFQFVWYTNCFWNCTDAAGWNTPINVSGPFVSVNGTLPFFVLPQIERYRGCFYIYYHGVDLDLIPNDNELVWGVNSCDNWNAGGNERRTDPGSTRAVNPALATSSDGKIYMAYSEVMGPNDISVYFLRGERPVELFLPAMVRK